MTAPPPVSAGTADTNRSDDTTRASLEALRSEIAKAVVRQDPAVTGLVVALLCRGHVLLEGVPGVAKTLLVRALAASLELDTKRLQFTPDLMPSGVTGSLVYNARTAEFSFPQGPVFTNLLLADEINRTPPKTQSSLLEAMGARSPSTGPPASPRPLPRRSNPEPGGVRGHIPATRGPVGPLPPQADAASAFSQGRDRRPDPPRRRLQPPRDLKAAGIRPVAGPADLEAARAAVARTSVSPEIAGYVVDICRATRDSPSLSLGVSPRGATALLSTARAWAWLTGRDYVIPDDVKALALPTLHHRVQLRPEAEMECVTPDSVITAVLAQVPVPR